MILAGQPGNSNNYGVEKYHTYEKLSEEHVVQFWSADPQKHTSIARIYHHVIR
jgi:hypothetical protein